MAVQQQPVLASQKRCARRDVPRLRELDGRSSERACSVIIVVGIPAFGLCFGATCAGGDNLRVLVGRSFGFGHGRRRFG